MGSRRFARLTNAFSKPMENHALAPAIYLFHARQFLMTISAASIGPRVSRPPWRRALPTSFESKPIL
jgi:hypothetical protein